MDFQEFKDKYEHKHVEEFVNQVPTQPVVSVCVQTYNHAAYIKECLDGILMQQTDFNFEILLGDDDSNDGTREICLEYAQKYPQKIRLFLHHRENNIKINGNPSGRFNLLYNLYSARGKYIALCEGDDCWIDSLKLQKQVDFMEVNEEYSMCFHNGVVQFEPSGNRRLFKHNKWISENTKLYNESLQDRDYSGKEIYEGMLICPTASMVLVNNKRIFNDILSLGFSGAADMLIILNSNEIGKIKGFKNCMSVYRVHCSGLLASWSNVQGLKNGINHRNVIGKHFSGKYEKSTKLRNAKAYLHMSMFYINRVDVVNSTVCIFKSVFLWISAKTLFRNIVKN